jgi:hypothetical protein
LAVLALDIVDAVLDGRELDETLLRRLRRQVPFLWAEQRELLHLGHTPSESRDPAIAAK